MLALYPDGAWAVASFAGKAQTVTSLPGPVTGNRPWESAAAPPREYARTTGDGMTQPLALRIGQVRRDAMVANEPCTYVRVTGAREEALRAVVAEALRKQPAAR